jgi:hypothetical protein
MTWIKAVPAAPAIPAAGAGGATYSAAMGGRVSAGIGQA